MSPADGAAVPLTLTVRFGIANMTSRAPGTIRPNSGHHHLLIDAPLPPLDEPIPSDENHLHFGTGQTEATITLTPGGTRCNCCSATPITCRMTRPSIPRPSP